MHSRAIQERLPPSLAAYSLPSRRPVSGPSSGQPHATGVRDKAARGSEERSSPSLATDGWSKIAPNWLPSGRRRSKRCLPNSRPAPPARRTPAGRQSGRRLSRRPSSDRPMATVRTTLDAECMVERRWPWRLRRRQCHRQPIEVQLVSKIDPHGAGIAIRSPIGSALSRRCDPCRHDMGAELRQRWPSDRDQYGPQQH